MKISIIGAGSWGLAIHSIISQNISSLNLNLFISNRTIKDFHNFINFEEAVKSDVLILAISAQHLESWLKTYVKQKLPKTKILIACKGIDKNNNKFMSEICEQYFKSKNIAYLSGPSFASEVIEKKPTALVINSKKKKLYNEFSSLFDCHFIKTYYSKDIIGAEIAGSYKNVLAIASGICQGSNLGKNAQAALIARGLVEMSRFGKFYGAKNKTFLDLSGAGDLFLTASSELSRNFRVGLYIGQGMLLNDILKELNEVAEGVDTTYSLFNLSSKNNIYTPIVSEVKQILEGKDINLSLKKLIS